MIGRVLDRYRIESKLGEGGMGVVYKARDTQLDRAVAIKILPHDKFADPIRKQRFVQEARAASALNHPGIVTIHDVRSDAGIDFIVMEHVEGKTLDLMIPAKGLRPAEALRYGVEKADALAKAHEAGIIHRDLKPSNVMITGEGRVKILDFGLAKLLDTEASIAATKVISPLTEVGMVVGSVAYMSPEQAEGRNVDTRSDIFSLGAVLYEMVTGRKPFAGDTPVRILTNVVHEDPVPASKVVASVSPDVEKIIVRCLRKDPARRYQTMADLKVALEDVEEESAAHAQVRGAPWRRWMWPAIAAVVLITAGALAWRGSRVPPIVDPLRAVPLTTLAGVERSPTFSPDGDRVAFSWNGSKQDNADIYVQQINSGAPLRLTTAPEPDYSPAWSPDGRWVAFLRGQPELGKTELRLIAPLGGPERRLAEVRPQTGLSADVSAAWSPDSTSVIVSDSVRDGEPNALFVVALDSGEKRQLTHPPPHIAGDSQAAVSPDGRWLVFRRTIAPFIGELYRLPLAKGLIAAGEPSRLTATALDANNPAWMPDSREILFSAKQSLWRLAIAGAGTPARLPFVGEDGRTPVVSRPAAGGAARLAYARSYSDANIWRVDTTAPGEAASSPPVVAISSTRAEWAPQFSPDGRRVAFASNRSGELEIWLADPDGANAVQLTAMGAFPGFPRWSADGELIAFHSNPEGEPDVFVVPAAGGKPRNMTPGATGGFPAFSRDGRWLYFSRRGGGEQAIWKMPLAGGDAARVTANAGLTSSESSDGDLYYSESVDGGPSRLWRRPASGGAAIAVLERILFGSFSLVDRGIYYMDRTSGPRLQYLDLGTGRITTVASGLGNVSAGITASPDGRTILFSRTDSSVDDLMLVENFR
jgi:serine/threonine protein kinase